MSLLPFRRRPAVPALPEPLTPEPLTAEQERAAAIARVTENYAVRRALWAGHPVLVAAIDREYQAAIDAANEEVAA